MKIPIIVICHMALVAYQMSHVTFHLSCVTNTNQVQSTDYYLLRQTKYIINQDTTITIKCKIVKTRYHVSGVTCPISCVMCHVSHVNGQLSPVTRAKTATATDHPPADSPLMHSRLVCLMAQTYTQTHDSRTLQLRN